MTRELSTLLRDAVVPVAPDTARAIRRGRSLRRRRVAVRATASLGVLAVVGTGIVARIDAPVAPQIMTAPTPSTTVGGVGVVELPMPVAVAVPQDDAGFLLRAELTGSMFRHSEVIQPHVGADVSVSVRAVGPDGTTVTSAGVVRRPDGTTTQLGQSITTAAVTLDGTVLALSPAAAADGLARLLVAHPTGGVEEVALSVERSVLLERDHDVPDVLIEDGEVSLLIGQAPREVQQLLVWRDTTGVVVDAELAAVDPARVRRWTEGDGSDDAPGRGSVALADGTVISAGIRGGDAATNAVYDVKEVVGDRVARTVASSDPANMTAYAYVTGPVEATAAVVPIFTGASGSSASIDPPVAMLSADGAVWLAAPDLAMRAVAPGGLPDEPALPIDRTPAPAALLPDSPTRATGATAGVAVAAAGDVVQLPDGLAALGPVVGTIDGELRSVLAVGVDGSVISNDAGPYARSELIVAGPGGTSERVAIGDLWGVNDGRGGMAGDYLHLGSGVVVDSTGNLWALADRWWSGASYPDLVVRRPGEPSFTSVGHLRLKKLLGVDVRDLVLHVEGDEVAIISAGEDVVGRWGPRERAVVARDGAALTKVERAASVGRVRGLPELPVESGWGTGAGLAALRESAISETRPSDVTVSFGGPFAGPDVLAGAVSLPASSRQAGPRSAPLAGGIVTTDVGGSDSSSLIALAADATGAVAAIRVPADGFDRIIASADGAIWLISTADGGATRTSRKLLDAGWQAVA